MPPDPYHTGNRRIAPRPGLWIRSRERAEREVELHEVTATRSLPKPFVVRDQGEVPCCVSAALTTAIEIRGIVLYGGGAPEPFRLSALQHYYYSRSSRRSDGGLPSLTLDRGLDAATSDIASFEDFPTADATLMTLSDAKRRPPRRGSKNGRVAYDHATGRAGSWNVGRSTGDWIAAIDEGMPVVVGFLPPSHYWEMIRPGRARTLKNAGASSRTRDGHAVTLRGYVRSNGGVNFVVRDSFGPSCGRQGEWLFPEKLVGSLVEQAYCIRHVVFE